MTDIITWNVNGIRAGKKHGLFEWLQETSPDILCVQETKAQTSQLTEDFINPDGYKTYWASAEKKGYSGVATFTKKEPLSVETLGIDAFDSEGRVQILEFDGYTILNCYFPNSQSEGARLGYKLDFCTAILKKCEELRQAGKNVILCGDYNIAHKEIDLKNPKTNQNNPGFLPEERAWMDEFIAAGYVDCFREFDKEPDNYTWWSYRFQARQKNIGWRIDYHCVNEEFKSHLKDVKILKDVMGSDHCPVLLRL